MFFFFRVLVSTKFSILVCPLPLIVDTNSLYKLSLGRKTIIIIIIINFQVVLFIRVNPSPVNLKKSSVIFHYFSAEISVVKLGFDELIHLSYYFLTFSFISLCLMVFASNICKYLNFSFWISILMFCGFCCSLPPLVSLYLILLLAWILFHFPISFLYPSCIFV